MKNIQKIFTKSTNQKIINAISSIGTIGTFLVAVISIFISINSNQISKNAYKQVMTANKLSEEANVIHTQELGYSIKGVIGIINIQNQLAFPPRIISCRNLIRPFPNEPYQYFYISYAIVGAKFIISNEGGNSISIIDNYAHVNDSFLQSRGFSLIYIKIFENDIEVQLPIEIASGKSRILYLYGSFPLYFDNSIFSMEIIKNKIPEKPSLEWTFFFGNNSNITKELSMEEFPSTHTINNNNYIIEFETLCSDIEKRPWI
jgi:hypothetical protein